MRINMLGTGAMGSGIALNLWKSGADVGVWNLKDRSYDNLLALKAKGIRTHELLEEAAADADVIGISVTNDQVLRAVCANMYAHVKAGAVIMDFSTVSPEASKEMAEWFAKKDVSFLDAPVSGGMEGAQNGTLTVMVGGDQGAYEKVLPLIEMFATVVRYMGPSGSGEAVKLVNQLLTGVNQAVVCEAMALAKKYKLDLSTLYEVLVHSWGNSKMLERSVPSYIIPEAYESAACISLMLKDLNLVLQMGDSAGKELPLTQKAASFYQRAFESGLGDLDHSAIIQMMGKEN